MIRFYSAHPKHSKLHSTVLMSFATQAYQQLKSRFYENSFSLKCLFGYNYDEDEHIISFQFSDSEELEKKSVLEWEEEVNFIQGYMLGCVNTFINPYGKVPDMSIKTVTLISFHKSDNSISDPYKAHPTDAGWDLPSAEDVSIGPGERKIVDTGISLETPIGFFAMITPRSGLAAKHGITIVNAPGVIDSHYRGNLKVILLNTSTDSFKIQKNDRIAQLIFMGYLANAVLEEVGALSDTDRGTGGLGSTGK